MSLEVWRGRSAFNGQPIRALLTGHDGHASRNSKTGGVAQLWILPILPTKLRHGIKAACPAACPLRDGGCYAWDGTPAMGAASANRGSKPGSMPSVPFLRLGALGDPAAVGARAIRRMVSTAKRWTGYTHAWRSRAAAWGRAFLMASVETREDAARAHAAGWRTFRIISAEEWIAAGRERSAVLMPREIMCPASAEAGKRTTCADCGLCNGARPGDRRASVAIVDHSARALAMRRKAGETV